MQAFHIELGNVYTAIITILADGTSPLQPEHCACKGLLLAETADSKIVQGLVSCIGTGCCRVFRGRFHVASGGTASHFRLFHPWLTLFNSPFSRRGPVRNSTSQSKHPGRTRQAL